MPYKAAKWFLETFIMVSRIHITFEIRFVRTCFAENLFHKHYFSAFINSFHGSCLTLPVQSRKFPENNIIMKWNPAYDIYKLYDKGLQRTLTRNERQRTFLRFASWTNVSRVSRPLSNVALDLLYHICTCILEVSSYCGRYVYKCIVFLYIYSVSLFTRSVQLLKQNLNANFQNQY